MWCGLVGLPWFLSALGGLKKLSFSVEASAARHSFHPVVFTSEPSEPGSIQWKDRQRGREGEGEDQRDREREREIEIDI